MRPKWRSSTVPNDEILDSEDTEETPPLLVEVKEPKKEISIYDSVDNENYIDHRITKKEIEEFENGDSSG